MPCNKPEQRLLQLTIKHQRLLDRSVAGASSERRCCLLKRMPALYLYLSQLVEVLATCALQVCVAFTTMCTRYVFQTM